MALAILVGATVLAIREAWARITPNTPARIDELPVSELERIVADRKWRAMRAINTTARSSL